MNLQSTEYGNQKGFCEDSDERKYFYPIVHLLAHKPEYETQITGISDRGRLDSTTHHAFHRKLRIHILQLLNESGTFSATLDFLKRLETEIEDEIEKLESLAGNQIP